MTIVLVCIGIAVVLSLFSYVENENWRDFHSQLYSIINKDDKEKTYGYQKARSIQNWTLSIISIVLITLFSLGYFGQTIVNNFAGEPLEDKASDLSDTTAFTLNNIETELPPSEFSYQGDGGDGQPEAQEGVENPDEKSDNKEFTDISESIKDDYSDLSPEEKIRKEAEDYKNSLNGENNRNKIIKQTEKDIENIKNKNKTNKTKVEGGVGGTQGSQTSGTDGVTMVEWSKKERKAYNNDDWNIRVPGYTCGIGVNDKVVLKLRVDMSGKVLGSEVVSGSNSCCIEQAKNYAKKSKFEPSDKMIQYINVTYRFKSQ